MSQIVGFFKKIYPNFSEARKSRRKIRQQYRKNQKALDRDDDVELVMTKNDNTGYLTSRSEETAIEADHLVQKYGSESDPFSYRVMDNKRAVKKAFSSVITEISRRNLLSYATEILFIVFVVLTFSLSIILGAYSMENLISSIAGAIA
ncbi:MULTISPECIES: hypothetical protein [Haloarcula]|uniref:hypothetical protein n=1 Tax=Haloarcula TaxID=2237 RepID=UPI000F8D52C4|nr:MULTISPECIES: hypothetical protein [Haloarcula]NHX41406.1 hypothetical protein [Haloarcula sp. R1-2]